MGEERKRMKKEEAENDKRSSLKSRLMLAFVVTSIIPFILINLFAYYNTRGIVRENVDQLATANLNQTKSGLDIWLDSYEDILFQIYMNDDIVENVENINAGKDVSMNRKALRRTLHGMFYTKEYIKSITILTKSGEIAFYDLLSGSTTQTSWMNNFPMDRQDMYQIVSQDNNTHIFSTQEASTYAAGTYYLFHLGHRIINYKDVNKQLGIVIVSVDEQMLREACNAQEGDDNHFNFIVDRDGKIVSYTDNRWLGKKIMEWSDDVEERRQAYRKFLEENNGGAEHLSIYTVYDEKFDWEIINVSNQQTVMEKLNAQQNLMGTVLCLSLTALTIMILLLTKSLTGSLKNMVQVMKKAGRGELNARVCMDSAMPSEVATIAQRFNQMLEQLSESLQKEKEAVQKQKSAEIAALEAQINPHFLYNTLDTINWMAIEQDEYEISNAINSLATILRYGISQSNEIVMVQQEEEWLKQYLFLQQTRLKNTFQCDIHVQPEVKSCRIHKLLLQPFVENAILHGFEGVRRTHYLSVTMQKEEGFLTVEIYDNGKGMPAELVEAMNRGVFPKCQEKNHIGMENAITRIGMYYGEKARVRIESEEESFTRIYIRIPFDRDE